MSRMKTMFMATVAAIFGNETYVADKGAYAKQKQNQPKADNLNTQMKLFRDREQGAMSRRVARKLVKLVKLDDKKSVRVAERKSDPERYKKFARA